MKERRKLQRFSMRLPAKVESNGLDMKALKLETRDISSDGAFLRTDLPVEAGTKVKLELELPVEKLKLLINGKSHVNLIIRGTVVRREESGIAVQFSKKYKIDFSR